MALQETQAEPSMEEILASIRRIISEDEPQKGEVLDLVEPAPPAAPEPASNDLLIFEREEPPIPAPAPMAPMVPVMAMPAHDVDGLVSEPVVAQAAGAFTRLAGSLRISEMQGQTLEGVVRDVLRPMLRDWLEENLPKIVESKVEAELERISRMAR